MEIRERLLKIDEVADWTGIPENTLRFWRAKRLGPPLCPPWAPDRLSREPGAGVD